MLIHPQFDPVAVQFGPFALLIGAIIVFTLMSATFISVGNISNLMAFTPELGMIALAMTLLMTSGEFDLSVGSVFAFAPVVMWFVFNEGIAPLEVGFLIAIAIAVLIGVVNGLFVTKLRVPPFIATLAMQTSARGLALLYTAGQNIYEIGSFTVFGQSAVLGLPTPVIFMIGVTVLTWYLLNHTRFGRYLYAIGGNEEAARASGVQIDKIKMLAFVASGALVGLSGVLYMSRVNAGLPNAGVGFEFDAMTAAVISA